jgi:hypothetical protein
MMMLMPAFWFLGLFLFHSIWGNPLLAIANAICFHAFVYLIGQAMGRLK